MLIYWCAKSTRFYSKSAVKRKIWNNSEKKQIENSPYKYNANNKIKRNAIIINCYTGLRQSAFNKQGKHRERPLSLGRHGFHY